MNVNQDKPSIKSWRIWRKAIKLWAYEKTPQQPLGEWYKSGNDLNYTWPMDIYRKDHTSQGQDYRWVSHMAMYILLWNHRGHHL
eukprot:13798662-Ditylum_brightwellii.AAC.1